MLCGARANWTRDARRKRRSTPRSAPDSNRPDRSSWGCRCRCRSRSWMTTFLVLGEIPCQVPGIGAAQPGGDVVPGTRSVIEVRPHRYIVKGRIRRAAGGESVQRRIHRPNRPHMVVTEVLVDESGYSGPDRRGETGAAALTPTRALV